MVKFKNKIKKKSPVFNTKRKICRNAQKNKVQLIENVHETVQILDLSDKRL